GHRLSSTNGSGRDRSLPTQITGLRPNLSAATPAGSVDRDALPGVSGGPHRLAVPPVPLHDQERERGGPGDQDQPPEGFHRRHHPPLRRGRLTVSERRVRGGRVVPHVEPPRAVPRGEDRVSGPQRGDLYER